MAHNDRPKMSTCPICGYTDTADDADALQMAIEEHVRMAHNLDPATMGATTEVKPVVGDTLGTGGNYASDTVVPIIPVAPSAGGTGSAAPTAPAAIFAANVEPNDSTLNSPRNDDTGRY